MVYDPNNDIEKKKKEAEEKYGKKNEIPYIYDYDMGEDAQHMYKWRSPAEREAIYNNMLERYKNAKSTEELKKVFSNSDKPFLRQMDDLNSLSKEQAQSINAEYSKRYLELIKEENPEEYKKNKKYLEGKYNIKSDASVHIDSLIDIIEYIDAKKKEFKESDVNRDADGKFAKKGSSSNKSNDATSGQTPKKENDKSKDNEYKEIDFNNIKKVNHIKEVRSAEKTLNKFYHKTLNYDKDYLKKEMRNHLKYLDMEGNTGALFNNIRKRIEDALNDKSNMASAEDIKKAISKLPKAQQSSAELIYNNNGSKKANELFSKYEQTIDISKLKDDESKVGAAKRKVYKELTDGAKAIYGFSSISDYKFYKEGRDKEIINLINNNPNPPATVYRGEGLNRIAFKNIKIGQSYFEIKQNNSAEENYGKDIEIKDVNSSNASYDMGTAFKFADESAGTKVVHVFENTKNISSVSYYDYENECFIDKREQILYDIYQADNGTYYLMYQPKNNNDNKIDAKKKEFKEEDVNRDEDSKFASKNSSKNKSNKSKDNDKKDGLDYGDLPKELHEPFKRLNTVKKAGEYIFNKNNEYKITEKDIKKKTDTYRKREKPDWVYVNLHNYYEIDDIGEHIGEPMNLTNRDNLKSDIEKFLFDFTCNSDEAKEKWGEKFESEIKPKLKQMIKNAPILKGTLYRVETWTHGRDIEVGKSINFDCRSSADDNMGYEVSVNFSQEDYEAGEEIYIFEFPEGTNALNIQGVSTYINEHEYLVDGDFIIESIEEDEFGYKQVKLVRPEDYEPPEPEDEEDEEDEEDGILDLRKYNEDEDDDDNYSPFDNFDPNWKPSPYGSDDDY